MIANPFRKQYNQEWEKPSEEILTNQIQQEEILVNMVYSQPQHLRSVSNPIVQQLNGWIPTPNQDQNIVNKDSKVESKMEETIQKNSNSYKRKTDKKIHKNISKKSSKNDVEKSYFNSRNTQ